MLRVGLISTVPWLLSVFSHTGSSLLPAPPLCFSAASLLVANPVGKKTTHVLYTSFTKPDAAVCNSHAATLITLYTITLNVRISRRFVNISELYTCQHLNRRVFKHQVHIQCGYKGLRGWTVQWLISETWSSWNRHHSVQLSTTKKRMNLRTQNNEWELSCHKLPASEGNLVQYYVILYELLPDPSTWSVQEEMERVTFVSRGGNHCHASKPPQIKENHTARSESQVKRQNPDWRLNLFSKCFKFLRSWGRFWVTKSSSSTCKTVTLGWATFIGNSFFYYYYTYCFNNLSGVTEVVEAVSVVCQKYGCIWKTKVSLSARVPEYSMTPTSCSTHTDTLQTLYTRGC